jgi:hypothetical protein
VNRNHIFICPYFGSLLSHLPIKSALHLNFYNKFLCNVFILLLRGTYHVIWFFFLWPQQQYVKGTHKVLQHIFSSLPCFISFILNDLSSSVHFFHLYLYFTVGNRISRPNKGENKTKVIQNTNEVLQSTQHFNICLHYGMFRLNESSLDINLKKININICALSVSEISLVYKRLLT